MSPIWWISRSWPCTCRKTGPARPRAIADASGIKFDLYRGNPVQIIREQAAQRDVRMLGIGARGLPAHRIPAGHVTLDVVRSVPKPVLVVPPDVRLPTTGPLRVLAPIDEEPASAATLRWLLAELKVPSLDLVLLRVVDAAHMPRFANHPPGEAEVWAAEFVRATVPREAVRTRVETRVGIRRVPSSTWSVNAPPTWWCSAGAATSPAGTPR